MKEKKTQSPFKSERTLGPLKDELRTLSERFHRTPSEDLGQAGEKYLIVILGPTAVGKTSLAIDIATQLDTEIISADSRQFYREMNIGTAKPSAEELKKVKHHFNNSLSITDEYNVGKFEKDALQVLNKIFVKKNVAVMAGGSGLYIHAVCNGFDSVPEADKEVRENLSALYKEKGIEALQGMLKKLDSPHYKKVDIKNPHRLIRAIEVCMVTGKPYSELRESDKGQGAGEKKKRQFTTIKIGLELGREELYARINARVDEMMKQGLLEEVKSLKAHRHRNSLNTVGYKELFDYLDGKCDLQTAIEKLKQNTRNFAKRQLTWFRRDKEIKWFSPNGSDEIVKHILSIIE